MTGRDLIIYILANGLEDEPVFKDGKVVGLMTIDEAATKFNVGPATIYTWITQNWMEAVVVGGLVYIPVTAKSPEQSNVV